jgi:hypothetical protein
MVAEFCAVRPVNTESAVRGSGRASLTAAGWEARSRASRGAIIFLRLTNHSPASKVIIRPIVTGSVIDANLLESQLER